MITVLMVTQDAEDFIRDQLNSILAQSIRNFHISIVDAGSKDNTPHILEAYAERYPGRFTLCLEKDRSKSRTEQYLELMKACRDDYIFLCDQDDVWKFDKMERSLAKMKALQSEENWEEIPILVHTDIEICDHHISMKASSWRKTTEGFDVATFKESLFSNDVFLATILYNRALAEHFTEVPPYCINPAWWASMTALLFGKKVFLENSSISFRDHEDPYEKWATPENLDINAGKLSTPKVTHAFLAETYRQAGCFLGQYELSMDRETFEMVQAYSGLAVGNFLDRGKTLWREKFWRKGLLWKCCQILFG